MRKINSWYLPENEKHLVKYITREDGYQADCRKHALSFVKEFRTCIDIGAHVGLWARELSEKFQSVIALEPVAAHRECFVENVPNKNVVLCDFVAGETNGLVALNYDGENTGHTRVEQGAAGEYKQVSIDWLANEQRVIFQNIDFMKLDCEGYEYYALKGAEQTILKHKPIINIEQKRFTYEGIDQYAACRYLESLGAKLLGRYKDEFVYGW